MVGMASDLPGQSDSSLYLRYELHERQEVLLGGPEV